MGVQLPKPFLRASPSFLVPAESNMTLRCWTPVTNVEFTFSKGRILLPSKPMVSVDHSGRMVEVPPRSSSKPNFLNQKRPTVTPGENVTLQEFVSLLTSRRPSGNVAHFAFGTVRVRDHGSYRCVYYQTEAPFWASQPSNSLELWVTGKDWDDFIIK
ncbi:T-cell-interacting, activating receptor on myeloid cells protein 1-like [Eumetopias jubatus]|uniref:T-cell-interacting, activating receptor on myeloid cells protein 1-like n=1 Tax=Eumetopias jubatus TaxID=34886 RepID=UPI001016DFF6|nr:T-cell-interacting, activating receptor on myeloid cells protein 1-like [Eumetopias jubatus]